MLVGSCQKSPGCLLRIEFSPQDGCDLLICEHVGQAIGTQQQDIPRFKVHPLHFDLHTGLIPAQHTGYDMPKVVVTDSLGSDYAPPGQFRSHRVVSGQLSEFAFAEKVTTTVPSVHDEQLPATDKSHRKRRAHPHKLWMVRCLLENPGVSSLECRLEFTDDCLFVARLDVRESLEDVKDEVFDRRHA